MCYGKRKNVGMQYDKSIIKNENKFLETHPTHHKKGLHFISHHQMLRIIFTVILKIIGKRVKDWGKKMTIKPENGQELKL